LVGIVAKILETVAVIDAPLGSQPGEATMIVKQSDMIRDPWIIE
jgi:hypothetical protein